MDQADYQFIAALGGPPEPADDLDGYLRRICGAVSDYFPGADAVGITAALGERFLTASFTDSRTLRIDADQYALDDGPCIDAYRNRRTHHLTVADAEQRWPRFAASCRRDGVQGFIALPLITAGRCMGALNLYAFNSGGLRDVDMGLLEIAASRAADMLAVSVDLVGNRQLVTQLEEAIASRAVIEQAKGVLMALHGLEDQEAFEMLRRESQRTNVKLREVARNLLEQARASSPATQGDQRGGVSSSAS